MGRIEAMALQAAEDCLGLLEGGRYKKTLSSPNPNEVAAEGIQHTVDGINPA